MNLAESVIACEIWSYVSDVKATAGPPQSKGNPNVLNASNDVGVTAP
jgi:hypothetical protein